MKVAFALALTAQFFVFEDVARILCERGHSIIILGGNRPKAGATDRVLRAFQSQTDLCQSDRMLMRREWRGLASVSRELLNCSIYLRPEHPSPWLMRRWTENLPLPIRKAVRTRWGKKILANRKVQDWLRGIEDRIPPDPAIMRWVTENAPDIVVASPVIYNRSQELEYVKAACALGIPTFVAVISWDNLTTKGSFLILPDKILVWNHFLLDEAVRLHNVPREKVLVTGAPKYDAWFSLRPSRSRAAFYEQAGIAPGQSMITYVCSSGFIAQDETQFVRMFAASLKEVGLSNVTVLVRPHPLNAAIWQDFTENNVVVLPKGGDLPDTADSRALYYDTLVYSAAVVGVNTSAFLEAAIADRPCVTIVTDRYRQTQTGMAHFHLLLLGDFLEMAYSIREAGSILEHIMQGRDAKANNRRQFVKDFLRPYGLDRSASSVIVEAIETTVGEQRRDSEQIIEKDKRISS